MALDRDILREMWDGKLPVCFALDNEEICDLHTPEPYYLNTPRVSYFPLVWDKARRHFLKHTRHSDKLDTEMWLDYNGVPLKWHYPIGLLFDLFASDSQLPWTVTVHFDKYPEHEILHCPCREVVESYFMSTLKEADALKHRGQVISTMQKKEHIQLWQGLVNDKFDQFWDVNKKLMNSSGNDGEFKNIPFRCYFTDEGPFVQRLMKPCSEVGQPKTLYNLLQDVFPKTCDKMCVLTHGIEVPLDTPLQWMSEHLSYPDNFLHLCVSQKS